MPQLPTEALQLSLSRTGPEQTTAAGHRLEALFTVAPGLGLRQGGVLGLRWVDVDFAQHSLRIMQTAQPLPGRPALETPKTKRSARLLLLPMFMERALARHAEREVREQQLAGDG